MDLLDPKRFTDLVRRVTGRTHNMPEQMRKDEIAKAVDEEFEKAMEKTYRYRRGRYLFEGSEEPVYFNTNSLGNWLAISDKANVPMIPAAYMGSLDAVTLLAHLSGNSDGLSAENRQQLEALLEAVQGIDPSSMCRFDGCMPWPAKFDAMQGKVSDYSKGWHQDETGQRHLILSDKRLVDNFISWPEPNQPLWARPWIQAHMIEGVNEEGERVQQPSEWRVYVRHGEIIGVSNYYMAAKQDAEDDQTLISVARAVVMSERILTALRKYNLTPHHPRYEFREDLDVNKIHCTLDFLETPDRQLLLLEGGPAHLRDPHWGAHPCNFFATGKEPDGVAFSADEIWSMATFNDKVVQAFDRQSEPAGQSNTF